MRLYSLRTRLSLPLSLQEAWDFFSDPRNLQVITPPALGFRITSELPERMHAGLIITYTVTPVARIPVTWVTEITHLEERRFFVDEQRFGPYRFWHHQHHFREVPGGVEVTDLVNYAPPTPAARIIDRLLVGPKVKQIFEFRSQVLRERFGSLP
jgi:ligand-binding SRPBCC domain-containing protein